MNRILWWLADRVSALLEPDERDAVRGDFAETGVGGAQALRESVGLVARRQVGAWKQSRPWLALLGLAVPGSVLFSGFWWRWLFQQVNTFWSQGVRMERALPLADDIVTLFCGGMLVCAWSWIGGFTAGSLSRRTAWLPGLFTLFYLSQLVLAILVYFPPHWVLIVLAGETMFILIPCLWGLHSGVRATAFGLKRTVLWTSALAVLTLILQIENGRQQLAFEVWKQGGALGGKLAWDLRPLPFAAILWQSAFLFVTMNWRRPVLKETTT